MAKRSGWGYAWRYGARAFLAIVGLVWAAVVTQIAPGLFSVAGDLFPFNFVLIAIASILLWGLPFVVWLYLWIVLDPEFPRRPNRDGA